MARHFSRRKGVSGSLRPSVQKNPDWVMASKDIEVLIEKLAKEKTSAAKIGIILRDSYGIPSVKLACGKNITEILEAKGLGKSIPQDLIDVIAQAIKVRKHLEANGQDKAALRGLQLAQSRIAKLSKYYKRMNKIPQNWKFDPEVAGMYLE